MRKLSLVLAALVLAGLPVRGSALTLPITSPAPLGLDQGFGCLIANPSSCVTLDAPTAAGGSLTLTGTLADFSGVTADVSITVALSSFGAGAQTFVGQTYTATGASVLVLDDGLGGWSLVGLGFASGAVSPADASVQLSALNCSVDQVTLIGQCGFTWGGAGDFTASGYSWEHTFNVVVPEPASAGLVALGLAALGRAVRRRQPR